MRESCPLRANNRSLRSDSTHPITRQKKRAMGTPVVLGRMTMLMGTVGRWPEGQHYPNRRKQQEPYQTNANTVFV